MKKVFLSLMCLSLLVFALAGVAQGWQGRMGGLGDPYGLISDESDFLIHPAKIATGEGTRLYGNYRFTYRGVTDWSYSLDWFIPPGVYLGSSDYDTSGDELRHDALMGIAFPAGSGRMGIFFEYTGMRGDYSGNGYTTLPVTPFDYDLEGDLDAFTLSLLYGLPVGGLQLGGEVQFAYCQEENETQLNILGATFFNNLEAAFNPNDFPYDLTLFPFMLPYDSSYMEALLKGSLEGAIGPVEAAFTLEGGFIFGGDNQWEHAVTPAPLIPPEGLDMDGSVEGWRIGGDLWLRYPVADDLMIPFLVRIDYQAKTRDGDGLGSLNLAGLAFDYKHEENSFELEVGGGLDKELVTGTRLAAGIYYSYYDAKNDLSMQVQPWGDSFDYSDIPDYTEHRVRLGLAGEHELSPAVALRMGLDFFFGWVREDYEAYNPIGQFTDDISLHGSRWGIGGSVGAALKFQRLTLEPFVSASYQVLDLDGDGTTVEPLATVILLTDMAKQMRAWSIGGGFSVLFDL
jgi:hypothetical protein